MVEGLQGLLRANVGCVSLDPVFVPAYDYEYCILRIGVQMMHSLLDTMTPHGIVPSHIYASELSMHSPEDSAALSLVRLENRQLQETIRALREALEHMQIDKENSVHNAVATANHEIAQLKAAITAQREAMEHLQSTYEEKMQALERRARDEGHQLQQTIVALRELLEAHYAQHAAP
jgi:hypothetical protein